MRVASVLLLGLLPAGPLGAQAGGKPGRPPELPYEGKESLGGILARLDATLVLRTWRAKGVLVCSHGFDVRVCLWVENAYPCGVFEILRQPWRTQLSEMKAALQALEPVGQGSPASSSHSPVSGDGTALQFGEARVYTFVPDLGFYGSDLPLAIPSSARFWPDYVSELDAFGWRSTMVDSFTCPEMISARLNSCSVRPDPVTCAGTWGSYFPRIGFVEHPSPALGAAVESLRAGRAASRPLGRVVLAPYEYEPRTGHYLQMIEPLAKPALSIGSPLAGLLDQGAGSPWGNYLFVHFGIFDYCSGCLPARLVEPRPPF